MLTTEEIIICAKKVLKAESQAIEMLIPNLGEEFVEAVKLIYTTQGRVITTGMGKPGYIAHKLAATLMSTGTPSFYLHPAEAIHGDLGMVTASDIIIAVSNSGETAEIINILPTIHKIGAPLIAICGNQNSTLSRFAAYSLNAHVTKEICPLNLAPTTSTTAQLALGDALAVTVMTLRQFTAKNFSFYHPGGNLGQMRLLTAKQLVKQTQKNPQMSPNQFISDALFVMTESGVGAVCVVDDKQTLLGIITDGDIRRHLKNKGSNLLDKHVKEIMTQHPTTIQGSQFASEALALMENHKPNPITVLPVINEDGSVIGMIHLTDLLKFNNKNSKEKYEN